MTVMWEGKMMVAVGRVRTEMVRLAEWRAERMKGPRLPVA